MKLTVQDIALSQVQTASWWRRLSRLAPALHADLAGHPVELVKDEYVIETAFPGSSRDPGYVRELRLEDVSDVAALAMILVHQRYGLDDLIRPQLRRFVLQAVADDRPDLLGLCDEVALASRLSPEEFEDGCRVPLARMYERMEDGAPWHTPRWGLPDTIWDAAADRVIRLVEPRCVLGTVLFRAGFQANAAAILCRLFDGLQGPPPRTVTKGNRPPEVDSFLEVHGRVFRFAELTREDIVDEVTRGVLSAYDGRPHLSGLTDLGW